MSIKVGIVTLALVSHFWPLREPAKSLEMLQRHEAKRAEFGGGELCQRDNALLSSDSLRPAYCQAAATAARHVSIAAKTALSLGPCEPFLASARAC